MDATRLTTALGSFGDLNIAAKYLKQVDSDGYLTENIAGSFLHNAYKTHTAEEVAATYSNTTASSGGLGSLFGGAGLMAGIKSAGSGLLTVLSSIAPALLGLLGVGIVFQAGKTVWDNILTNNGSKKRYPTSSKTYQEVPFIIANVIFAKYFYDRNRFPSVPASVASP
ncbi:hypothetical protein [Blautia obeum]|uniref:hypothetical protein n=1 Tax=Blautia obeum TaxID=40520 RepID=UPI00356332C0